MKCPHCNGSGRVGGVLYHVCDDCGGTGRIEDEGEAELMDMASAMEHGAGGGDPDEGWE